MNPINSFFKEFPPDLACWIGDINDSNTRPSVMEYQLAFEISVARKLPFYVTADQYYILYLDGIEIGRTNDRGTLECWFVNFYEPQITPGHHVLSAIVWSCGELTAHSVESDRPSFWFCPYHREDNALLADWRQQRLYHTAFSAHHLEENGWTSVAPGQITDYNHQAGEWQKPDRLELRHRLYYSSLPLRMNQSVVDYGDAVYADDSTDLNSRVDMSMDLVEVKSAFCRPSWLVDAGKQYRIIIKLTDYSCGWLVLSVKGGCGSKIRMVWAESLFMQPQGMEKGSRDEIDGKFFRGIVDEFRLDGNEHENLTPLVWGAGNFIELVIETKEEPLLIGGTKFVSCGHFPEVSARIACDDVAIARLIPICVQTFKMTAHDNLIDCPYYEQIPYTGDGRIQTLINYTLTSDDRLVRKMLFLFAQSCRTNGVCKSRTPSRFEQYIPSFSLWFVGLIYDYAQWRNDPEFVRYLLLGMRSTLRYFIDNLEKHGVYRYPPECDWNFMDWSTEWRRSDTVLSWGVPPAANGENSTANWQLVYALNLAAQLEEYVGEPKNAAMYRNYAEVLAQRLKTFFNPACGLYADDTTFKSYSEHSQILAILSMPTESEANRLLLERMLAAPKIAKCSLFFTHYLWDAAYQVGHTDACFNRLNFWHECLRQKFRTFPETFYQSRSDCHGWGAMVLYHLTARIGGIHPGSFGFSHVEIAPELGTLTSLKIECPHPKGTIWVKYEKQNGMLRTQIVLPEGIDGELILSQNRVPLHSGSQDLELQIIGDMNPCLC